MTSELYFNIRAFGSIVMGAIIFVCTIALFILDRLGRVQVDDDPKRMLIGTVLLALFGLGMSVTGWLSVREPKGKYKFTNKPSGIRR